jgi:hypothetical protein
MYLLWKGKEMTDLTEQWKKGELPEGHYYIKTRSETNIDELVQWYKDHGIPSEKSFAYFNVQQVLAPVPSYEEWKAKLEENTKLKELLEDCVEYVKKDYGDYLTYTQSAIYEEINQALGEDK